MTERMLGVLRVLDERGPQTANQIAGNLGFYNAPSQGGLGGGRGSGAGTAPAQRVIFSINALKGKGLVAAGGFGAYDFAITSAGEQALREAVTR